MKSCHRSSGWLPSRLPVALLVGLFWLSPAPAQQPPALPADESPLPLLRTAYTPREGAPMPVIQMAQGRDGLLWMSSSQGLFSFDGLRFERFVARDGPQLPADTPLSLAVDAEGALWLGFRFGGVYRVRDGRVTAFVEGLPMRSVVVLAPGPGGALWAGTTAGLYRLQGRRWQPVTAADGAPLPTRERGIVVDRQGALWLLSRARLFRAAPGGGPLVLYQTGRGDTGLLLDPQGRAWWADNDRLWLLDGSGRSMPQGRPPSWPVALERAQLVWMDRLGYAWAADRDGLLRLALDDLLRHLDDPRHPVPVQRLPLNAEEVNVGVSMLDDREGNVWLSTYHRFEKLQLRRLQALQREGRAMADVALAADGQGDLWLSSMTDGLLRWRGGELRQLRPHVNIEAGSLLAVPDGMVWLSSAGGWRQGPAGLQALPPLLPGTPLKPQALARHDGALWASLAGLGLYRLSGDRWLAGPGVSGLPEGPALSLWEDERDATLWLGYVQQGAWSLRAGRLQHWSVEQGLDVGHVLVFAPGARGFWVGGSEGVAWFDGQRFHRLGSASGQDLRGVSGLVETPEGELWLHGASGVIRVSAAEVGALRADPRHVPVLEVFNADDGLVGRANTLRPLRTAARTGDGRLWFATELGLFWLDPARLARNAQPPQAQIRALRSDGRTLDLRQPQLQTGARSLQVDYTAAGLTQPGRLKFWFRLVGQDGDWQAAGTRRQAFYTNLAPGSYRFEVFAENEDGVRGPTAQVELQIPAALWQTPLFRVLLALLAAGLLWGLYRLRLRNLARLLALRLEARLLERGRIARDLHDHLLQEVQALLLRLHVAVSGMGPADPQRERLETLLDEVERVVGHTRDQVSSLRQPLAAPLQLFESLRTLGEGLATQSRTAFEARLEGQPATLLPEIAEELHAVAREALRNAFQHAGGRKVQLVLRCAGAGCELTVQDDGVGFDPGEAPADKSDHWGLVGMRERAERIGATLRWQRLESGGTRVTVWWGEGSLG